MIESGDKKTVIRAASREELIPLVDFCKRGCLYDVQAWIAAGKPVNPPETPPKKARIFTPLFYAIQSGFHTLVSVLLDAGAQVEYHRSTYTSVGHAAQQRRLDLVELLVAHGADVRRTPVEEAFYSWDPGIVECFIEHGADMETGRPLAQALSSGIRPALGIQKRHQDRFPSFREQANIALRYHCKEGSRRWVALLLWAGADPFMPGESEYNEEPVPGEPGLTAVEFAALYGHYELLSLPFFVKNRTHPGMRGGLCHGDSPKGAETIRTLLKAGLDPADQPNGGSSAVQRMLEQLFLCHHFFCAPPRGPGSVDRSKLEPIKDSLSALVGNGALWRPQDRTEVMRARQGMRDLPKEDVAEIVMLICSAKACSREAMDILFDGDIGFKVLDECAKIERLMEKLPSCPVPKGPGRRKMTDPVDSDP